MELTQERLKELLNYDSETGEFRYKKKRGNKRAGERAGCVRNNDGYRQICVDYEIHLEHGLAIFYETGKWPVRVDYCYAAIKYYGEFAHI